MKNLFVLLSILITSILVFSFTKKDEKSLQKQKSISLSSIVFTNQTYSNKYSELNRYPQENKFNFIYGELSNDDINLVLNNLNLPKEQEIFSVTLYKDEYGSNLFSQVKYVSVFYYNENTKSIEHRLFDRVGKSIQKYDSVTQTSIIPGYISLLANGLDSSISFGYLIYNQDADKFELGDDLEGTFRKKVINNAHIGFIIGRCTETVCKMDVDHLSCGVIPQGGLDCGVPGTEGACGGGIVSETLPIAGLRIPQSKVDAELKDAYSFRDDFLRNSDKGVTYINYYYMVSTVLKENKAITTENVKDYWTMMLKLNNIGQILANKGNDAEIVITSEISYEIESFVNNILRKVSSNEEYINALDDVLKDLKQFSSKTKKDILDEIN